jgi:hypothetical protein
VTNSSQVSANSWQWGGLGEVIVARDLDEAGVGDALGDVAASGDGHEAVSGGVDDQCRCGDLGQGGASVEVDDAVDLASDVGVRGRLSLQAPEPPHERGVVRIR